MQPENFFFSRSAYRLLWKLPSFSLQRPESELMYVTLCEFEGMLETYHSHYKTGNISALNSRCFQGKQRKGSFFLLFQSNSFFSSIYCYCTVQDTFPSSRALQCFDNCVCVCVQLVCEARMLLYLGTQQQRAASHESQAMITLLYSN